MTEPNPIDAVTFNALLDSVGGDREFLAELLETYFTDSPALFAAMQTALAAGKADDFRRAAHSLKSNSASFGALALSRLAKELEDLGRAGTLEGAAATLARAQAEYDRVKVALA